MEKEDRRKENNKGVKRIKENEGKRKTTVSVSRENPQREKKQRTTIPSDAEREMKQDSKCADMENIYRYCNIRRLAGSLRQQLVVSKGGLFE